MDANHKDRMEQWLDSALRRYGDVQPQPGLEKRVLATLAARNRSVVSRKWTLSFAGAAVLCLIFLVMWHLETGQRSRTNVAKARPRSAPLTDRTTNIRSTAQSDMPNKRPAQTTRRHLKLVSSVPQIAGSPQRLAQFPSPRPLTERELILAEYVARFPREAELIATEQQRFEQEMQQTQREFQNTAQISDQER